MIAADTPALPAAVFAVSPARGRGAGRSVRPHSGASAADAIPSTIVSLAAGQDVGPAALPVLVFAAGM